MCISVSPALHEFFVSLQEKIDTSLAPLPEQTARLSAQKFRKDLQEYEAKGGRTKEKDASSQEVCFTVTLLEPASDRIYC